MRIPSIFLFLMLTYGAQSWSFTTLTQAITYSTQHPEFPESDNDTLDNPSFMTFYQLQRPSTVKQLGQWLGIIKTGWNPYSFSNLLNSMVQKYKPLIDYYAAMLTVPTGTQLIVLGDINGNYHSLVRILQELYSKKVLDNQFKLTASNYYFVINGNGIGSSAYALQTLELLLHLLQANPNACIYSTGPFEEKKRWTKGAFRQSLDATFRPQKQVLTLLENLFNSLFAALYVSTPESKTSLRISYLGNENKELKSDRCSRKVPLNKVTPCLITQKGPTLQPVSVMITAPKSTILSQDFTGLYFGQEKDKAHWSFTSSASMQYRMKFRYFYDAFTIITIGNSINTSAITLYNRDVRYDKQFKYNPTRNLYTGKTLPIYKTLGDPLDYITYGKNLSAILTGM